MPYERGQVEKLTSGVIFERGKDHYKDTPNNFTPTNNNYSYPHHNNEPKNKYKPLGASENYYEIMDKISFHERRSWIILYKSLSKYFAVKYISKIIDSKIPNKTVLYVSNDREMSDLVHKTLINKKREEYICFIQNNFELTNFYYNNAPILDFKKVINLFNEEYSLKLPENINIESQNFHCLKKLLKKGIYINECDVKELNDFVICYKDYLNYINLNNLNHVDEIKNNIKKFKDALIDFKEKINYINDNIEKINSIYSFLGIKSFNSYEFYILDYFTDCNVPNILYTTSSDKFIKELKKYQTLNSYKSPVFDLVSNFHNNNQIILDIIKLYEDYVSQKDIYEKIYINMEFLITYFRSKRLKPKNLSKFKFFSKDFIHVMDRKDLILFNIELNKYFLKYRIPFDIFLKDFKKRLIDFIGSRRFDGDVDYVRNLDAYDLGKEIYVLKERFGFKDTNLKYNNFINEFNDIKNIFDIVKKYECYFPDDFIEYSYSELIELSRVVDFTIKENLDKEGFIDKVFIINSYIDEIKSQLNDYDLDFSIFNKFKFINLEEINEINIQLNEIKKLSQFKYSNAKEAIENEYLIFEKTFYLINNYPIIFLEDTDKFSKENLDSQFRNIHDKFSFFKRLHKIEKEISSYNQIIDVNLKNIWEGFFTDISKIERKFSVDLKFTNWYNNKKFSKNFIENIFKLSNEEINCLITFKNELNEKDIRKCIHIYDNHEILLSEIDTLIKVDENDIEGYYYSFKKINKILKKILNSKNLDDLINILSKLIFNDYFIKLDTYKVILKRYFNNNIFISHDELTSIFESHKSFTRLTDEGIITEKSIDYIVENNKKFLNDLETLEKSYRFYMNCIFFVDENTVELLFNESFSNYFDYVILNDSLEITDSFRRELKNMSKNELYTIWHIGSD